MYNMTMVMTIGHITNILEINMITLSKSVLKSKMLEYFRNAEKTGEEIVVTDHRKPVLRIIPIRGGKSYREIFAPFQGKARYMSSVTEPETAEWGESA